MGVPQTWHVTFARKKEDGFLIAIGHMEHADHRNRRTCTSRVSNVPSLAGFQLSSLWFENKPVPVVTQPSLIASNNLSTSYFALNTPYGLIALFKSCNASVGLSKTCYQKASI